jgi:hypothetical protein
MNVVIKVSDQHSWGARNAMTEGIGLNCRTCTADKKFRRALGRIGIEIPGAEKPRAGFDWIIRANYLQFLMRVHFGESNDRETKHVDHQSCK